jgi:hypothetical protein
MLHQYAPKVRRMSEIGAQSGSRNLRVVGKDKAGPEDLVEEYLLTLEGISAPTVEVYGRILRSLAAWVAERPGGSGAFRPELLARTALETYLKELEA